MRNVIMLIHMSLDGYVAPPDGSLEWITYNEEIAQYSYDMHAEADTAIFGRATYHGMQTYWPTVPDNPDSTPGELEHARWLEDSLKIVVSRTLDSADWGKSLLIKDDLAAQIHALKQQPGKDMLMLGSPGLAQSFMRLGLIDEYRVNINPVLLGGGFSLFGGLGGAAPQLELVANRTLKGGVAALRYRAVK